MSEEMDRRMNEEKHRQLFDLSEQLQQVSCCLLQSFDQRKIKLFSIPPHKRIFLFFLTRALKTYQAVSKLCLNGYGQDAATLLRSLLENLISFRYILHDLERADTLSARFVGYKWVLFQRHLAEQERDAKEKGREEQRAFAVKKNLVLKNVEDFKSKYNISSGRALLTWSGRTVKDMAGIVSKELLKEYESTFRMCSKFTHPCIISDKEYMIIDDEKIVFSVAPSLIGVNTILVKTISYTLTVLNIFNSLFELDQSSVLKEFDLCFKPLQKSVLSADQLAVENSESSGPINRESVIVFKSN